VFQLIVAGAQVSQTSLAEKGFGFRILTGFTRPVSSRSSASVVSKKMIGMETFQTIFERLLLAMAGEEIGCWSDEALE
jgi:hypothetical protein